MSTKSFIVLCIQACLVQNALSTIIGPAIYGNGFGLGNSVGAGLTAASAELAGWYGCGSPAQYAAPLAREIVSEYAYAPMEIDYAYSPCAAREFAAASYAAPLLEAPFAAPFAAPYAAPLLEAPFAAPYAVPYAAPYEAFGVYGGEGIGDVAVAGEMPVAGTTLVTGQVPILGAVRFAGDLPAGGVVTIAGSCGCNCAY